VPRQKDFDETVVLDLAVQLFWTKGYNGTSMQDIVDHLGISRSSLYDTFGDKRQLFIKSLHRYQQQQGGAWMAKAEQSNATLPFLREMFETAIREIAHDTQSKGCFMVNAAVELAPHDPEVAQIVVQNKCQMENAFAALILKGQLTGEISTKKDALSFARFLFHVFSSIRLAAKSAIEPDELEDIMKVAFSVLSPD
jgi:TetR/AcrR family transcriptional repressor of nem operon